MGRIEEHSRGHGYHLLSRDGSDRDMILPERRLRLVVGRTLAAVMLITMLLFLYPSRVILISRCNRTSTTIEEILRTTPLVDGHNDFPLALRYLFQNHIYNDTFTNETELPGQVDFPRLRKGMLGAQFWSVYAACPEPTNVRKETDFGDEIYYSIIHDTLQQIDLVQRLTAAFPANLIRAHTAQDIIHNHREDPLQISSLMGVEGLHMIGNSPSILRLYYSVGVRYATLTHFCHNKYADSASQSPYWRGLSEDGKAIIREMNRLGMAVDLAHTSQDTMRQTLEHSMAPVIFSHASAYGCCPHPRNVPDDVLFKLKANRGVIMITFVNEYINCQAPGNATIADVADHILYVGSLIGFEHIGIGSDYDGMLTAPIGLEDVSTYPSLFEVLRTRGVADRNLRRIAGENVLRAFREIEMVSAQMQHLEPLEDDIART